MLQGQVTAICCSDNNMCSARWGDMWQGRVAGIFCPQDMSHRVHLVELHGSRRGDKISPKLVWHKYKSISSQEGTCRCNISVGPVPATFSSCNFYPGTRPCYMSRRCAQHRVFVGAT